MVMCKFLNIKKYPYQNKDKDFVHFFIVIAIGLFLLLGTHFIQHTEWGETTMNWALDYFIKREAQNSMTKNKEERILYIDINDDSYERWGKPLLIPRDKIASIIEFARTGGAKVVVLDILFDFKDCSNLRGDARLREVLENIQKSKDSLKIIFPTLVYPNGKVANNIFDDLITNNKGVNFHYGLPYVVKTKKDSVTRYWLAYEKTKTNTEKQSIIWGIPLLAVALYEREGFKKIEGLQDDILGGRHFKKQLTFAHKNISIMSNIEDDYSYRIRFLQLPQNLGLNRIEAQYIYKMLTNKQQKNLQKTFNFKDKIVIIGNSTSMSGDNHLTPVGEMAGLFIIGNAINTLINGLQMSPPSVLLSIRVEIFAISIFAWFFLYYSSLVAQVFGTIALLVFGSIKLVLFY